MSEDPRSGASLGFIAPFGACASLLLAWALGKTGWASRHPRWLPWVAVLCAAVPVALALLPFWGDGATDAAGDAGTSAEDPYYQSDWD